jgi:hypothetical protein
LENLSKKKIKDETILYDGNTYEILTSVEGHGYVRLARSGLCLKDDDIEYEFSPASDEYICFMLRSIKEAGMGIEFRKRLRPSSPHMANENMNIFDYLRFVMRSLYTIKIRSTSVKTIQTYEELSNAFVFHLGFNLDLGIVELRYLDEYLRIDRISQVRNVEVDQLQPPKRKYIPDLIYHYQMGISTDSPLLQFVSFYHIIEHFFDNIYNDDMIKQIQIQITSPSFSPKNEQEVKKLIKFVSKKLKIRNDSFDINEQEALELSIKEFVNLENLKDRLFEYDHKLISYYKNQEVFFSKGNKVDLENSDKQSMIKNLAARIYKTRNAVVHSKDTDKDKYWPLKHDKFLLKEIPLMRFIAEDIIIATSTLI